MLHGWELIVVLLIILLLFGAKRIPELGKGLGAGIRSFKSGLGGKDEDKKVDESAEESDKKLLP